MRAMTFSDKAWWGHTCASKASFPPPKPQHRWQNTLAWSDTSEQNYSRNTFFCVYSLREVNDSSTTFLLRRFAGICNEQRHFVFQMSHLFCHRVYGVSPDSTEVSLESSKPYLLAGRWFTNKSPSALVLVRQGLWKWASRTTPLGLLKSVEDELARVNEPFHTIHKADLRPRIELWTRFLHAFFLKRQNKTIRLGFVSKAIVRIHF